MIRIALVSPFTLPFYCGNSIMAERLRAGLTRRGYDVALFDSERNDPAEGVCFDPHVVHSLNAGRPFRWIQPFRDKCRVPWVITLTGTDYNSWLKSGDPSSHVRESLETADALVVFHDEALTMLGVSLPQLKGKMQVIPQGVAPSRKDLHVLQVRETYGIDPECVVFLMVSGIRKVKNIGCAIEAFYEVESKVSNGMLLHVGPIMEKQEASRLAEQAKNLKCLKWLGGIPPTEVRRLMAASDVFLNTSYHEGMSGAILEAMAEGLPVLASAGEGNRSLVKDGVNGLLFPIDDRQGLALAAIRLAGDPLLRKNLGTVSSDITSQRYSEEKELDFYERVYLELLPRPPEG